MKYPMAVNGLVGGSVFEIATPSYHVAVRDHLRSTEPELWAWFGESVKLASQTDDAAELALLKSAYRLDGGTHDVLVGYATLLASKFEIDEPVVLYQALETGERNAQVFRLNGQVNVLFSGDLLDLLTAEEQHAVLAHELAHIALFKRENQNFFVLDHMVHRLSTEVGASDALIETARRLRLHTEVWADAAAAEAVEDINTTVSAIVKVNAGLRHVDASAYLRQADQILELDSSSSGAWTHPELHIRVACISARTRGTPDKVLASLISGPDDLDRLDLLGQLRMQGLTARVLHSALPSVGVLDGQSNYVRSYSELNLADADPIANNELASCEPSVRWLAASLLVDFALSEDELNTLDELRRVSVEAERQGVGIEFDKILARATDRTQAEAKKIREEQS